ncbi:MAG: heme NO-binding protein [Rhodobacterales bacterium]|nr:MAG: heme NO-binding protein [Rhodobacterales bacterium]
MHGLINRSLEFFISDTYGADIWQDVARGAGLGFAHFESMLEYDDSLTYAVLDAAVIRLSKPREILLEDMGTYLVSNPKVEALRRLLRFGGVTFVEFLHSLEDLHGWAKLAVPELKMPKLHLTEQADSGCFKLSSDSSHVGFEHILMGLLRAMADDYGALVLLDRTDFGDGRGEITIQVIEASFADGRDFSLAGLVEGAA